MNPDGDPKEDSLEDIQEDLPVAGNRLWLSLMQFLRAIGRLVLHPKHMLQAGVVKIIDAGSGLLQRLRKRAAEPTDEKESRAGERSAASEKSHAKDTAREEHGKAVPPKEVAAPQAHSSLQSILLYLLVLVVGIIAGMIFSYALLSTMVSNQAHKIEDQRDEINQLEKQHTLLLESEAKFRKENLEYRQRLSEMEKLAAPQNAVKEPALPESASNPAGNPAAAPASGKQAVAKKTGNCNLDAGNIGNNLARCVDDFNRK